MFRKKEPPQTSAPWDASVHDYLLRHHDMILLVISVYDIASFRLRRGRKDTELSLKVYRDPEIDDEYLTLYVRQKHYDKNLLKTIWDIRAGYAEEMAKMSGRLLLTTDFGPPQVRLRRKTPSRKTI